MKNLPNLFTLLNLIFGCIAIVCILQTGETIVLLDRYGATQVYLPEKIWMGSLFIFGAAVIDFLDGFLARAMKAQSAMGEQLDSLSDVVSFGIAPGMILYQLLRIGYAQEAGGLDVSLWALLPAFLFSAAVAWRLAKFNISTNQTDSFRGVPSPAAGLVVASFPLIIFLIAELGRVLLTIEESSTFKILSPVRKPALSLGPSGITYNTCTVSEKILNSTPIPWKLPIMSSFTSLTSLAGIYTE